MQPSKDALPLVLLVDDSDESLEILTILLSSVACRLKTATSGEQALELVRAEKPALVVLDVNMPGMDGYEVCRKLREDPATRESLVLFVSARGDLQSKLRGFEGGAVDYIAKPFEPEEVMARISTQLELYHLRRELELRHQELKALIHDKDKFLDLAAHDLRHPLLQIRGLVGLLRSGQIEEQGRQTLIDQIARASEKMNGVLNELIDFSELGLGAANDKLEPQSVAGILKRSVAIWGHHALAREIKIKLVAPETAPAFYDAVKLIHIVETIVAQIVDASPRGQTLSIKLQQQAGDSFSITLSHTGLDSRAFEKVFAALSGQSSDPPSPESLGLLIVGRLVRYYGGRLAWKPEETESLTLVLPFRSGKI